MIVLKKENKINRKMIDGKKNKNVKRISDPK